MSDFNKQIAQVGKELLLNVPFQCSRIKMNFRLAILMMETKGLIKRGFLK